VKIQVRVKPNSKSEEVNQDGDSLVVRVKAPPREGKANQAVIRAPGARISLLKLWGRAGRDICRLLKT